MVYERVAGAAKLKACLSKTTTIIVILEHADPEPFVEQSYFFKHLSSYRDAEHRQHRDREDLPVMLANVFCRPGGHLIEPRVSNFNLCFVGNRISHRANHSNLGDGMAVATQ